MASPQSRPGPDVSGPGDSPEPRSDAAGNARPLTGVGDIEAVEDARHPVPIERREGVFVHLYRCRTCQLKWAAFSWLADPPELRVGSVACPWCRKATPAIHERATVSTSVAFSEADLDAEVAGIVARLAPGARLMSDSLVARLDAYAGDVADRD